jgi:hypothetical protein
VLLAKQENFIQHGAIFIPIKTRTLFSFYKMVVNFSIFCFMELKMYCFHLIYRAALRYESLRSLALCAQCSIGDQLHPLGLIDTLTYDLIGSVYSEGKNSSFSDCF